MYNSLCNVIVGDSGAGDQHPPIKFAKLLLAEIQLDVRNDMPKPVDGAVVGLGYLLFCFVLRIEKEVGECSCNCGFNLIVNFIWPCRLI